MKRLSKKAAKRNGVSFFGKVNTHMLDNDVAVRVVKDDKIIHYYYGGMIAVMYFGENK